jgi:hypothetical protein
MIGSNEADRAFWKTTIMNFICQNQTGDHAGAKHTFAMAISLSIPDGLHVRHCPFWNT